MWTSSALLAVLAVPHLALAATPVCIEQAINEFENGGTCSLGDESCYCSSTNKGVLMGDINEACVNDSGAVASAQDFVQSFCASMTGGGSGSGATGYPTGAPTTSIVPHGVSTAYPTGAPPASTTAVASATAYPTMPGGVLPPITNATTLATGGGATGYPTTAPTTGAATTAVISSAPASGSIPVETLTSVATNTPAGTSSPSGTPSGPAGSNDGSVLAPVGMKWVAGLFGAVLVAGML